jgi:hypothetical protein
LISKDFNFLVLIGMVRLASPADNKQLLALTSDTPMQGVIALRIDRQPDFFNLLQARGNSTTYIFEKNSQIIGSISASKCKVFINGKAEGIYYISDLKVEKTFRAKLYLHKLISQMHRYLQLQDADLLFCTAALGNNKVLPIFDGRASIPKFYSLGKFSVFQLLPSKKRAKNPSYEIRQQVADQAIIEQFNCFYQHYQLGKVIDSLDKDLITLVAYKDKQAVAAITLKDTLPLKQNVVVGLTPPLRALVSLVNGLNEYLPIPSLPAMGEAVKNLYINNFYCDQGHQKAFESLIAQARHLAFKEKFHFVSIGLHEKDPLQKCFTSFYKFEFTSLGYIASLKNNKSLIDEIIAGIPFEDYSLV